MPLKNICLFTKNRPDSLHRCLASFKRQEVKEGLSFSYTVFDDVRSNNGKDDGLERLKEKDLPGTSGADYFGDGQRVRLAQALREKGAQAGVPGSVIDFALQTKPAAGRTVGANRNAAFLFFPNQALYFCDDDTVAEPVDTSKGPENHIIWEKTRDPFRIVPFGSRKELIGHVQNREGTLFDKVFPLLSMEDATVSVEANSCFPGNTDNHKAQPLLIIPGFYGDSGMAFPRWLFVRSGDWQNSLVENRRTYRTAIESREMLRYVENTVFSQSSALQTHQVLMDNRHLLPPFFPVLRNQDGLFAVLLRIVYPEALTAHIPAAIGHLPEEGRTYDRRAFTGFFPRTAEFLMLLAADAARGITEIDPSERMRELGVRLFELRLSPVEDFSFHCAALWRRHLRQYIGFLLDTYNLHSGRPRYWGRDLSLHISSCQKAFQHPEDIVPADSHEIFSDDVPLAKLQQLTAQFGQLLQFWPQIQKAAEQDE